MDGDRACREIEVHRPQIHASGQAHRYAKVEMLFAELKRILKLDRLRLRGPSGAHDELLLAATAQNLRRMAKWLCAVEPETGNIAI